MQLIKGFQQQSNSSRSNFNPEKYILNESRFDLTGCFDDDGELKDKVAKILTQILATDKTVNNEAQNINTRTLKKVIKYTTKYIWIQLKFTEAPQYPICRCYE